MKDQLRSLARVHLIDGERFKLLARQTKIEEEIGAVRAAVDSLEADLQRQREALAEASNLRKGHEADLKANEELIGRSKSKMASVKNAREYMAVEREVESARRASAMVEEQVLKLLESEEKNNAAIGEREERLTSLRTALAEETATFDQELAVLAKRLTEIDAGRTELKEGIEAALFRRYDRVCQGRNGVGLAAVEDGICGACNMNIPAQLYNILVRGKSIESCPSCHRIIYWPALLEEGSPAAADDSAPAAADDSAPPVADESAP